MRQVVAVLALLALAACGTDGTASETIAKNRKEQAAAASRTPGTPVDGDGEPAPEALSSFRCRADDGDEWVAAGYLTNTTKAVATYRVTVYVGPADGTSRKGATTTVSGVGPDDRERFQIDDIAADGDQCHVQVLRSTG